MPPGLVLEVLDSIDVVESVDMELALVDATMVESPELKSALGLESDDFGCDPLVDYEHAEIALVSLDFLAELQAEKLVGYVVPLVAKRK